MCPLSSNSLGAGAEGFEMMDDRGTQICFSLGPNRSHAITLWRARSGCVSGLFNAPLELFQRCKKPEDYHELISTYYPHIPQLWVSQIAEQLLVGVKSHFSVFAVLMSVTQGWPLASLS